MWRVGLRERSEVMWGVISSRAGQLLVTCIDPIWPDLVPSVSDPVRRPMCRDTDTGRDQQTRGICAANSGLPMTVRPAMDSWSSPLVCTCLDIMCQLPAVQRVQNAINLLIYDSSISVRAFVMSLRYRLDWLTAVGVVLLARQLSVLSRVDHSGRSVQARVSRITNMV